LADALRWRRQGVTAIGVPVVDVVVLTWNDGDLLHAAIDSILGSDGVTVRVIVVDNGSDIPATVTGDARVTLLRQTANLGVAAGRNLGVAQGDASLVCLLDSDARLEPGCLRCLCDVVLGDATVALAAPVFVDQEPEASGGRAPTLITKAARGLNLRDTYAPARSPTVGATWDVDFAIGACQLFRRVAFDGVGGIDATYFYGPEDVDFCLRLREAGWRVVQARDASCHHPPRRRFRRLATRRGAAHAFAVSRHLWRHRHFERRALR
jgi:N-acetylglucosaminyl-diphospho-decaprenol L-rhamnosyltransferase